MARKRHRTLRWVVGPSFLLAFAAVLVFTYGGLRYRGPTAYITSSAGSAPADLESPRQRRDLNIILISIDTLRADHLGCYGYGPPTSPMIDAFAREGVVFENAFGPAPSTLASHASIFTSMLPSHHGALFSILRPLSPEAITLAEILQAQGYATAGFHGGGQVSGEFGLGQGFDTYVRVGGRFHTVVDSALSWLNGRPDQPFFLFLHTFEVHHPYLPDPEKLKIFDGDYDGPLPDRILVDEHIRRINGRTKPRLDINDADLQHIVATYDAEIRSMDEAMGRLIAALRERSLDDDTIVIFSSDHGEEFGEHGIVGMHSHTLYDELLHVPLIVKVPGAEPGGHRVTDLVRLIDIGPTILDALDLPTNPFFEGASLMSVLDGNADPRLVVSQRDTKYDPPISALRTVKWKLYEDRITKRLYRARLFDLDSDPGETRSVLTSNLRIARRLSTQLRSIEAFRFVTAGDVMTPSPETVQRLKSLGYLD